MEKGTNVLGKVYETLLCSPGMNEGVKIDLKMSRKAVLLLSNVVERGLELKDGDPSGIVNALPEESKVELQTFVADCLQKAGLGDFNEKLKELKS